MKGQSRFWGYEEGWPPFSIQHRTATNDMTYPIPAVCGVSLATWGFMGKDAPHCRDCVALTGEKKESANDGGRRVGD